MHQTFGTGPPRENNQNAAAGGRPNTQADGTSEAGAASSAALCSAAVAFPSSPLFLRSAGLPSLQSGCVERPRQTSCKSESGERRLLCPRVSRHSDGQRALPSLFVQSVRPPAGCSAVGVRRARVSRRRRRVASAGNRPPRVEHQIAADVNSVEWDQRSASYADATPAGGR